jgi:hypothetical protein
MDDYWYHFWAFLFCAVVPLSMFALFVWAGKVDVDDSDELTRRDSEPVRFWINAGWALVCGLAFLGCFIYGVVTGKFPTW